MTRVLCVFRELCLFLQAPCIPSNFLTGLRCQNVRVELVIDMAYNNRISQPTKYRPHKWVALHSRTTSSASSLAVTLNALQALVKRLEAAAYDSSNGRGVDVQVAAEDAAAVAVRVRELLHQAKEAVLQAERQEVRPFVEIELLCWPSGATLSYGMH